MKRILACLPLGACAAAHAQSSVTLYGAVDAALTYTNNQGGKAAWQASSGGRAGDKFGLQGVEDLGGNLKAVFVLESGFSIEDGTQQPSNTLFGRQAYVGLSNTWGTVLLGRYTMTNDYLGPLGTDTLFAGGLGSTLGDLDGLWNYNKISNVVKFNSTDIHGFHYSAMYSLGGVAGDFATNRGYGFGASYMTGGLTLAAAYMNVNARDLDLLGAVVGRCCRRGLQAAGHQSDFLELHDREYAAGGRRRHGLCIRTLADHGALYQCALSGHRAHPSQSYRAAECIVQQLSA